MTLSFLHSSCDCLRRPVALVLYLLVLVSWARPVQATHIVGGEMELNYVSGNTYLLVLNLYFDAYNGNAQALDPDLTATIFQKSNNRHMVNVVLPLTSNTFVNYTNPVCAIPTLSTRKLVYSRTVTLPDGTYNHIQGYYVAVERCCRNNSINNIAAPGAAGQAFYLEFPAVVRGGQPFINSTPRIFPPLADYACRNELFYYDFGGQDVDGDSLAYDLVTPLNGHSNAAQPKPAAALPAPYSTINWNAGLGVNNQIPGTPTLRIDTRTGRLTVRPTNLGLFVFGVRCSEYRKGEKIGEARRDFQLQVLNCALNSTPSLVVVPAPTGQLPYRPGRDTLHLVPGGNRCMRLRFTDADPSSRLSVSINPVNFSGLLPTFTTATSGTVRTPGVPDTLTATLCFPDCMDTNGRVFLLDVIVADNGCSLPRRDTVRVAFTAVPPLNSPPVLTTTAGPTLPLRVRPGEVITFDLVATDPDNDPIQLEMTGTGFSPAAVGATLTQSTTGGQQRGRFSWTINCQSIDPPLREFQFTAATSPCTKRQAVSLRVPVQVDYANTAPVLTSSLPLPSGPGNIPVIIRPLDVPYTATLLGTDADADGLTLTASSEGFNLASAGMSFEAQNGRGQASGFFRWDASCAGVNLHRDLTVTFQLVDATCRPLPQSQVVRFEVQKPEEPEVKLYNVITPNADSLNSVFRLPTLPPNFCDAQFATVKIFSRWGQQVFQAASRDFRWKGEGTAGMYYYLVNYTDGRTYKGWLEVLP